MQKNANLNDEIKKLSKFEARKRKLKNEISKIKNDTDEREVVKARLKAERTLEKAQKEAEEELEKAQKEAEEE